MTFETCGNCCPGWEIRQRARWGRCRDSSRWGVAGMRKKELQASGMLAGPHLLGLFTASQSVRVS